MLATNVHLLPFFVLFNQCARERMVWDILCYKDVQGRQWERLILDSLYKRMYGVGIRAIPTTPI
jgi:hypothetical protein